MTMQLKGWHVLAMLVGFFAVVMAVNTLFVFEAEESFHGEDIPNAYTQGVDYNQTLDERRVQERLGWRAEIGATWTADGVAHLSAFIRGKDGALMSFPQVGGQLRHPSDSGLDRPLTFKEAENNSYASELSRVAPGIWDVIVHATAADGTVFEARSRVWLH